MHVLEFSDTFLPIVDGVGNVVYQYAINLTEKGCECTVVAPEAGLSPQTRLPFRVVDYRSVPLPLISSYQIGLPDTDWAYHRRLQALQADLVHVHSPFMAGHQGLRFAREHALPVVATFHSRYYEDFLQVTHLPPLAHIGAKLVGSFYNHCTEVWTPSGSAAEEMRRYGYRGTLRIVPNGTNPCAVDPKDVEEITERYHLGNLPVLLYVGQINWKKNLRCILEAAAQLDADFRLVLAGQGPHEKGVRALSESLSLAGRTILAGHLSDRRLLNALYARANLFVFPSLYDTAGLVIREAAAAGTPSVVVRGSGAAEVIRDGENGFLCANDPAQLAGILRKALKAPEQIARMGESARATIPLPWSRVLEGVLQRYKALISQR